MDSSISPKDEIWCAITFQLASTNITMSTTNLIGSNLIYYILKLSSVWIYETITYLSIWNYHLPEHMKISLTWAHETTTYLNKRNSHLFEHMKQMWESLHKIFTSVSTFGNHVTTCIQGGHLCNSSVQYFNYITPVSSRKFHEKCVPLLVIMFSEKPVSLSFIFHISQFITSQHRVPCVSQEYT